jgi:hypothetical protein
MYAHHKTYKRKCAHGRRAAFVTSDDSMAAGEPTECFNPVAVVMRAEALSRREGLSAALVIPLRAISATPK